MNSGHLSSYFTGVAAKRLSAVEVNPETSNQHEFNGVQGLKSIFGEQRITLDAHFIYFGDTDDQTISSDGKVTWYDARERDVKRTEFRLFYSSNQVMDLAVEGDLLIIGMKPDKKLMVLVIKNGAAYENQVIYLFGLPKSITDGFNYKPIAGAADTSLGFVERLILDELQIEIHEFADDYLEIMLRNFGNNFPKTIIFSDFARSTIKDVSALGNPDTAIMAWMDREELLFRTLERHIVAERLHSGFGVDVDSFIDFSLSVQNRRKSRVGYALENHFEQLLKDRNISYTRGAKTENKSKPDFLFPGTKNYHDDGFPVNRLTMLGVKSTCKDRWRQVLAEADRINNKHLLTLEPGISENQTDEMKSKNLQLVVPAGITLSFNVQQRKWLMDISTFIDLVKNRQAN
jgi:EcoRII C terminal